MYSYEIDNLLKQYNYNISSDTYLQICLHSPQIREVKYNPYGDYFEMWTDDYKYWQFTVYKNGGN